MHVLAGVIYGLIGLLVGARLQLIVQRTPMRERVLGIHQHCARCGDRLRGAQHYPWSAYLLRTNRCKTCDQRVWSQFPWLECVTALTFVAFGLRYGFAWAAPAYLFGLGALIVIFVTDMRHQLIPNRVVYPAIGFAVVWFTIIALALSRPESLRDAILGFLIGWGLFFLVYIVQFGKMGFGDVRLAGLIGLLTGWQGVDHTFVGLFLGIVFGGVYGLIALALRTVGWRTEIAYGPFLVLGGVVSIFWGTEIANWWLDG